MRRKGLHRGTAIVGIAGWVLAGLAGPADAQERVRWKLASSYTSTLDVLGQNIIRVLDNIEAMSDGNFQIQFNEPGALVPALEVFDAVSKGSVQASYTSTGFHAGRVPHMIFFASVPFGPSVNEYVGWLQAGGYEIYDRMYAEHDIKDDSVTTDVVFEPRLDEVVGFVPALAQATWTTIEEDGGYRVAYADSTSEPVLPADAAATQVAERWVTEQQGCRQGRDLRRQPAGAAHAGRHVVRYRRHVQGRTGRKGWTASATRAARAERVRCRCIHVRAGRPCRRPARRSRWRWRRWARTGRSSA